MNHQLANKRALVTGGSRGIRAAIVKRLAGEGVHVALTYASKPDKANETAKAARALGVQAIAIQADNSDAVAVNLRVVFVATQAALKHMKTGGRIITIGSCNVDRMPFAGGSVYAMSKAALVGLVKGMARNLGPRGITINNVQRGRSRPI
jgi:3-oxoacyl-[acyl-carrier protein] reductase